MSDHDTLLPGTGSCPNGLSPSVSGHSAGDPSCASEAEKTSNTAEEIETLKDLLERADLHQHILKTIRTGLPRVDPKAADTVARTAALKVRLALLSKAEKQ